MGLLGFHHSFLLLFGVVGHAGFSPEGGAAAVQRAVSLRGVCIRTLKEKIHKHKTPLTPILVRNTVLSSDPKENPVMVQWRRVTSFLYKPASFRIFSL